LTARQNDRSTLEYGLDKWYAASLLFKGVHECASDRGPIWEESVRLIRAGSESQALQKAELLGRSKQVSYPIPGGALTWSFQRVERVYPIEAQLVEGTEVFSRFLRDSEVDSLLTPFEDY
jgi:hypothetical protein